jgi:hypothetical protein
MEEGSTFSTNQFKKTNLSKDSGGQYSSLGDFACPPLSERAA